jgi:hypothetical protein
LILRIFLVLQNTGIRRRAWNEIEALIRTKWRRTIFP